jgi:hypothetical protein
MPTYKNNFHKEIMVDGDIVVQGNEEFELKRYLSNNEKNKYIQFISDDPPISPILFSFDETIKTEHEILLDFLKQHTKFDFHVNTDADIQMYFNSKNTYPVILKKGNHCFKNLKADMIRRILFVKTNDNPSNINGYLIVC